MKKKIWEIEETDLEENPVWAYDFDEEESDETTVYPASEAVANDPNTRIIVAAEFTDAKGMKYNGYIHFVAEEGIEYVQPVLFENGKAVSFWFGIVEPKLSELQTMNFPVFVKSISVFGLPSKGVKIKGYGYYNNETKLCYAHS